MNVWLVIFAVVLQVAAIACAMRVMWWHIWKTQGWAVRWTDRNRYAFACLVLSVAALLTAGAA